MLGVSDCGMCADRSSIVPTYVVIGCSIFHHCEGGRAGGRLEEGGWVGGGSEVRNVVMAAGDEMFRSLGTLFYKTLARLKMADKTCAHKY